MHKGIDLNKPPLFKDASDDFGLLIIKLKSLIVNFKKALIVTLNLGWLLVPYFCPHTTNLDSS